MIRPSEFRPEARTDVRNARQWYERQLPGLGEVFAQALGQLITRIESMPRMYPVAYRDARRAKIGRFPYLVYYRVLESKIEILAVLHGRRDPEIWRHRVE